MIQAPWRMSTADPKDFFNYDQDLGSWKEYQLRVKQFRVEYSMQEKIQTYEGGNPQAAALDPDLPPELAAAVLAGTVKVGSALRFCRLEAACHSMNLAASVMAGAAMEAFGSLLLGTRCVDLTMQLQQVLAVFEQLAAGRGCAPP